MIRAEGIHLGKTIGKLREAGGMSRKELAEAVGISESHLKKIEAGTRLPGIQTYERMIGILGKMLLTYQRIFILHFWLGKLTGR